MRLSQLLFLVLMGLAFSLPADTLYAKECYAPDARAKERAFSRAVTTEGGKIVEVMSIGVQKEVRRQPPRLVPGLALR